MTTKVVGLRCRPWTTLNCRSKVLSSGEDLETVGSKVSRPALIAKPVGMVRLGRSAVPVGRFANNGRVGPQACVQPRSSDRPHSVRRAIASISHQRQDDRIRIAEHPQGTRDWPLVSPPVTANRICVHSAGIAKVVDARRVVDAVQGHRRRDRACTAAPVAGLN